MTVIQKPPTTIPKRGDETQKNKLDYSALTDLACVLLTLVTIKQLLLPYSILLAGPASTLSAMIVSTWLLKYRGTSWSDLGLRKPKSTVKTLALSVLVFFTIAVVANAASWLSDPFLEDVGTSGRFNFIRGNLLAYLGMLVLVWTHGSVFEELLFRAFLITRAAVFLGGGFKSEILAILFTSTFFGYRHYYYQGLKGAFITGTIGLALSLLYLWFGKKNIWPLIIGHGVVNTISQTTRFLGLKGD